MTYPHADTVPDEYPAATADAPSSPGSPSPTPAASGPAVGMFVRVVRSVFNIRRHDLGLIGEIIDVIQHHEGSTTVAYGPLIVFRDKNGDRTYAFQSELQPLHPVKDRAEIEFNRYYRPNWSTLWNDFIAMQRRKRPPKVTATAPSPAITGTDATEGEATQQGKGGKGRGVRGGNGSKGRSGRAGRVTAKPIATVTAPVGTLKPLRYSADDRSIDT